MIPQKTTLETLLGEKKDHEDQINRLNYLISLVETKYPDLKIITGRWNTKYSSKTVNSIATNYDLGHSCGCCSDAALLVYPYIEDNGIRIYSDPPSICIGRGNEGGYGEIPSYGWEDRLREEKIQENIIKEVEQYFKEHEPVDETNDDSEDSN